MKQHPTFRRLFLSEDGAIYYKVEVTADGAGYGMVTIPGQHHNTRERIHRLLWEFFSQMAVPDGMIVRHLNDDRRDNRAENLALGTQADNMRDAVANKKTTAGVKNAQAKLNEDAVRCIRKRRQNGETLRTLASEYGITVASVCDICKRRTWKHVR